MAHDVFISYSSSDKTVADAACARLEARGIRCWIAPRDVPGGMRYGAAIVQAINASRVMVLILSSSANTSQHIPNEIERGVNRGLPILPFRIEDVAPAESFELFIGSVHWLDALTKPLEQHLDRLAESVLRLLPERPASAPALSVAAHGVRSLPRPRWQTVAVVAAVVIAVTGVWLLTAWSDRVTTSGSSGAAAVVDPEIVGCWRWGTSAPVAIRNDGTMTAGPFSGSWRRLENRSYTLSWPARVEALIVSSDGRNLAGHDQYGAPTSATRVDIPGIPSGDDLSGVWGRWNGSTVVANVFGSISEGSATGTWRLADGAKRLYEITWPTILDSVTATASADGSRIQGTNSQGVVVSAVRMPTCD